jgi:TonB family protein
MYDSFDPRFEATREDLPESGDVPAKAPTAGANALDRGSMPKPESPFLTPESNPRNPPASPTDYRLFLIDPARASAKREPEKPGKVYVEEFPFQRPRPLEVQPKRRSGFLLTTVVLVTLALLVVLGWNRIGTTARVLTHEIDRDLGGIMNSGDATPSEADAVKSGAPKASANPRGKAASTGTPATSAGLRPGSADTIAKSVGDATVSMHTLGVSVPGATPILPPVKVMHNDAAALLQHQVSPIYPDSARIAGVQGDVAVAVTVDASGNVTTLRPVVGDYRLVESAMDAVRQWRYRPLLWNGKLTPFETTILIHFSLVSDRPYAMVK